MEHPYPNSQFFFMLRITILISIFSFSGYASLAQERALGISTEYNIPVGKLGWSYKAAPGVNLHYGRQDVSSRRNREITTGYDVSIGYMALPKKADTLYYLVDDGSTSGVALGRAMYSDFKIFSLKINGHIQFPLTERTAFLLAGGIGYLYGKRSMVFEDDLGGSDSFSEIVGWAGLTPKAGVVFSVGKAWQITPYFSYTVMIQTGSTDSNSYNYNPDTGKIGMFYSGGISAVYIF